MPFNNAVDFFRRKVNVPARSWDAIWQQEHDVGFMVAGATKADLIQDMRNIVGQVTENSDGLHGFRKNFDQVVNKHGWGYNGGRNWRTRVIYETNLYQAHNAGRYAQIQKVKKFRPYLRYRHNDAVEHPRPEHLAWDSLILPVDDPWWDTHMPMNGWGCKCFVQSLNERDLKKLGKSGPDIAPPINMVEKSIGVRGPNPRTVRVPKGVDPGFAYTPGKRYSELIGQVAEKAGKLDYDIGKAFTKELVASPAFTRWMTSPPAGFFPVARLPNDHAGAINATARYAAISAETARKQLKEHPEIPFSDYSKIQGVVDQGERIQDGKSIIYLLTEEDGHVVVIKSTVTGQALFLTSFRRISADEVKRDLEIKRLRRKRK